MSNNAQQWLKKFVSYTVSEPIKWPSIIVNHDQHNHISHHIITYLGLYVTSTWALEYASPISEKPKWPENKAKRIDNNYIKYHIVGQIKIVDDVDYIYAIS